MKSIYCFLFLLLLAAHASAQRISAFPEKTTIPNSYLFLLEDPAVANYKATFGTLYSNITANISVIYSTQIVSATIGNLTVTNTTKSSNLWDSSNVKYWGALGGTNNDTAIVQGMINRFGTNGGTIFFPFQSNGYTLNLKITNSYVSIVGEHPNDFDLINSFKSADVTKPVIQVGNDSGYVYGFTMKGISIDAGTSPAALFLFGGPFECSISECSFYNGADTLKLFGGTNYPVTLINFNACNIWEGTNSTIYCLRPTNINGYVTGIYLNDSHVNGANSSGYAVRLDRTILSSVNTYYDLNDDHAVWIKNGGAFRGQNVELEGNPDGVGLVTVSDESVHDPSRFLSGTIYATVGTIKYLDATSDTIPSSGLFNFVKQGYIQSPFIKSPIYITATGDPFGTSNSIDTVSVNGPISITSGISALRVSPGIDIRGGNALIKSDLIVYGGNAAGSGGITADSASGGLYIYSSGTDRNIRLVATGIGYVWIPSQLLMGSNIRLDGNFLSGDGGNEGVFIDSAGYVALGGMASPTNTLDVSGHTSLRSNLFLPNLRTNGSPVALLAVDAAGAVYETAVTGGGGGSVATNANQFGASTTLTIKDGALLTNTTFYGTVILDTLNVNTLNVTNSGRIFVQTNTVIVTNTTTSTALLSGKGTTNISANLLAVGNTIRIKLWGVLFTTNGTPTEVLTFKVKLGGTTVAQSLLSVAAPPGGSNGGVFWTVNCDSVVRSTGATGQIMTGGLLTFARAAGTTSDSQAMSNLVPASLDTTVAMPVSLESVVSLLDGTSVWCQGGTIEIIP